MVIIGFSDIITNSSSEVYCVYSEEGINRIKELVNSILEVAGSDKKCDDLFEISLSSRGMDFLVRIENGL